MVDGKKITPTQLSSLVSAYDRMEERKRILRMKPKPRDADVSKPKVHKPTAVFQE